MKDEIGKIVSFEGDNSFSSMKVTRIVGYIEDELNPKYWIIHPEGWEVEGDEKGVIVTELLNPWDRICWASPNTLIPIEVEEGE